jgi:predicted house-cleaning noncanonical NTP pyrophosphatase (MazG superfamily)
MLAELAAANAAFSVIKQFVSNGKELSGCAKHISDFVFSKEEIEKNLKKKKARGAGGADLDEFMALEQIREKEEELKKMMIYLGRPGLWQDWQAFQAEARKSRRYAEKMAQKRKEELMEYLGYGIAVIIVLFFAGLMAWFVGKWVGRF